MFKCNRIPWLNSNNTTVGKKVDWSWPRGSAFFYSRLTSQLAAAVVSAYEVSMDSAHVATGSRMSMQLCSYSTIITLTIKTAWLYVYFWNLVVIYDITISCLIYDSHKTFIHSVSFWYRTLHVCDSKPSRQLKFSYDQGFKCMSKAIAYVYIAR